MQSNRKGKRAQDKNWCELRLKFKFGQRPVIINLIKMSLIYLTQSISSPILKGLELCNTIEKERTPLLEESKLGVDIGKHIDSNDHRGREVAKASKVPCGYHVSRHFQLHASSDSS